MAENSYYNPRPAEVPSGIDLEQLLEMNNYYDPSAQLFDANSSATFTGAVKPMGDPVMANHDPERSFDRSLYQNNFWLSQQSSASHRPMAGAFQPVSVSSQLPVGAEYQVPAGIDPMPSSPYSPESDNFSDDLGDAPFSLTDINGKGLLQLTEEQLVSLSARDLNRLCRDLPEDVTKSLKKRRRTLKNRGYAYNSRVRRVSQKNQLEKERDELRKTITQLQERLKTMERESSEWKRRCQALERGEIN